MTINIESVEIILESETTSRSAGIPVLAVNVMSVIQMFEWTGDVSSRTVQYIMAIIFHHLIAFRLSIAVYHW